jgi:ATP phosphoribosyltransferase regulatory subunit
MRAWLLPEHLEDVLPPHAWKVEFLRRTLLDHFRSRGYELVIPPLMEYLDSLLSGAGAALDLKTFKLVDQLTGRLMGVRADITPQVARIDAHLLAANPVNRLCYAGSVLHAVPDSLTRSREPLQIGAELYGLAGQEADQEIIGLMLAGLAACGLRHLQLDLGHVGVFRALAQSAGLDAGTESLVFSALQAKAADQVAALLADQPAHAQAFVALCGLHGGEEVLTAAREALPGLPVISRALEELSALQRSFATQGVAVQIDLGELRGYGYHSGVVFAVYPQGGQRAVALGGRYDEVGKIFGRARPATGFSLDLRELLETV